MSKILIDPYFDVSGIAKRSGAINFYYEDGNLYCDSSQTDLDLSLSNYDHGAYLLSKQPTYRDLRSDQYKTQLSPEGRFETTVGDILDAIIKHLHGDSTELDDLTEKINKIKFDFPKE